MIQAGKPTRQAAVARAWNPKAKVREREEAAAVGWGETSRQQRKKEKGARKSVF